MKLTRMDYYLSDRKASTIITALEQKKFFYEPKEFITIEPSAPRRCRTRGVWSKTSFIRWQLQQISQRIVAGNVCAAVDENYYPTPEESLQAALTAASIRQTERR